MSGDRATPMSMPLTFELTDDQRALRDTIREFAESEIAPYAAEWDHITSSRPRRPQTRRARRDGCRLSRGVRRSRRGRAGPGGRGRGAGAVRLVGRDHRRRRASRSRGEPLLQFGTEEQKQRWLVPLARAKRLGAFASTEPGSGSDVQAAKTTARRDERRLGHQRHQGVYHQRRQRAERVRDRHRARPTIDGDKHEPSSTFIVPSRTPPGSSRKKPYRKLGWHASDTRELVFTDCRVPDDALLGPARQRRARLPDDARWRPRRHRGDVGRARPGRAWNRRRPTRKSASPSAPRSPASRRSSSSSPN